MAILSVLFLVLGVVGEVAQVALHQDVVEAEQQAHQHEHLDHLHGGRHLQSVRDAQEPEQ